MPGQILAIGIKEPVHASGRQAKIDEIHRQGGLAFVCHPEEVTDWGTFTGFDGMEIYNVHAALKRKQKEPGFMTQALKILKEDPENVFSLLHDLDPEILNRWDELNKTRHVTGIAGNDAHQNVNFLGVQLDPYARAFKFVSTHVLAAELSESAVLSALRQGDCYVAFDLIPRRLRTALTRPGR